MAGHGDAACPGRLELNAVGNGEPFKVSEQGREQSSGPYFRKTPPDSGRRIVDRRRDAGTVGVTAVLFPSLLTQSIWEEPCGSRDLDFWSGSSPTRRPLVRLIGKLNFGASVGIGGLSELHQSDGGWRSGCGHSSRGLWHEH